MPPPDSGLGGLAVNSSFLFSCLLYLIVSLSTLDLKGKQIILFKNFWLVIHEVKYITQGIIMRDHLPDQNIELFQGPRGLA